MLGIATMSNADESISVLGKKALMNVGFLFEATHKEVQAVLIPTSVMSYCAISIFSTETEWAN